MVAGEAGQAVSQPNRREGQSARAVLNTRTLTLERFVALRGPVLVMRACRVGADGGAACATS